MRAELRIHCERGRSDCQERAERVRLGWDVDGSRLKLRVEGMPTVNTRGLSLRGRILVPRDLALEVDMAAGELDIRGVEGDLDVDLGAGEVDVRMRERHVRSVRLGVGIGEASLMVGGRSIEGSGWLGHKVRWGEGMGPARVSVTLGVGDVQVRLD